jgi:hypothetical protein
MLLFCAAVSAFATPQDWIGSSYASPMKLAVSFDNFTVCTVVHLTAGGDRLRL